MTLVRVNHTYAENAGPESTRCEWLVVGPPFGAVQYVEWKYPEGSNVARILGSNRQAVDVGYHSTKQRYEGQTPMDCHVVEGQCFYDGSGLHAEHVMREVLDAKGEDALWAYLDDYFAETFHCEVTA